MTAAMHLASFNLASLNLASLHAIAELSAARIVDCLVEGTLVVAFTGLVLRMARRWNSGARFAVWFSALMAVAALPLLGFAEWAGAGRSLTNLGQRPEITLPGSWALWLFAAWAVVAGVGVARVGVGLWRLRALRRSCVAVDSASLDPELRRTLSCHGKTRPAALCVSDQVSVPTVIGFVNPAVVIPRWLLHELSPSELQQILLHELAHLQRWDDWTNLAQKLLKALLFFHPAVWWIEKQLSLEREMACDDAVVAETANPRAYAECLTHLAEKSFVRRSLALAQAALGRIRQTSMRVAQLLDSDRASAPRSGWKPAVLLVAGFAIACAIGISRAPRLIGFEDSLPKSTQIARAATGVSVSSTSTSASASASTSASASAPAFSPSLASFSGQRARTPESGMTPHVVEASFHSQQPRVVRTKNARQHVKFAHSGYRSVAAVSTNDETNVTANDNTNVNPNYKNTSLQPPSISDLFCLSDFSIVPSPVTEAVFVIVEGRASSSTAPAAYRITVWRVLTQPAGNPHTNKIPHKET